MLFVRVGNDNTALSNIVAVEWLGDGLTMNIPRCESYVHTLGLSFQTNMTISHNPYQAFSLLNSR